MKLWPWLLLCLFSWAASAEKTFVYCSEASPSTFNPQMADDGPTFNASSQMIYNRLLQFELGGTKVVPALAKSWDITDHGKTYTFHLRQGVHFHSNAAFKPSRDFDADDVVFSFERALKKDHPFHFVSGGNYLYFEGMELNKMIKSVEKIDASTVRFTLNHAEAPFLADVAMSFAVILSKEYGEQLLKAGAPQKIDLEPIGTGPFVFKSYVKDNMIRYEAFGEYWAGRPKLDKIVFAITPDANVRFQKLRAGECQLIAEPSPQDIKSVAHEPKLKVVSRPGANVGFLAFNTAKPPFDKVEVRQAIAMALNRESYLNLVYQGTAVLAKSLIPSTVWASDTVTPDYVYDPVKAKALLAKAGYPNGFSTDLWTLPVARPYNPNGKKMGELMQSDLNKIGIKAKLVTYDWPTYLAKSRTEAISLGQFGWTSDNGDPDNFLGVLFVCAAIEKGANVSRWCDKHYDEMIARAKLTSDLKQRTALYLKAQAYLHAQVPAVMLAHATIFSAMAKNVEGYVISPLGTDDFYTVDLK